MSTFECNNQESNVSPHHPFALFNNSRPVILRYGREELIALYRPHLEIPDEIKEIPEIFNKQELIPFSLSPASETEQRNLTQALCGNRVNLNFKSNPPRPHGNRLILNSANRYPRANATNAGHAFFSTSKSVDWPCGDTVSSPDGPNSPEENPLGDMPSMFTAQSEAFNRLSRNKDFNKRPLDRRFPAKGNTIIAGSWRSSGNFKTDFNRRELPAGNDDQSGLPEWATDNTDVDAREMTFDNQGKFVHIDALEESKTPTSTALEDNKSKPPQSHKEAGEILPSLVDNLQKKPENDPVCFDINLLKKHIDALTSRDAIEHSQKKPLLMPKTVEWFYIDPQRQIRGPFSAEQMSKWYSAGYFTSSILLRRSTDKSFSHLGEYVNALGPGFLFSLAPIRGFSEMIDASLLSAQSAETNGNLMMSHASMQSRSYMPGKNIRMDSHYQTAPGNNLEGLLLDLLSQNSLSDRPSQNVESKFVNPQGFLPVSLDARTDGIVERLGYNDPSIMAISSRGSQGLDGMVAPYSGKDKWQLALERSEAQLHNDLVASAQAGSKLAPWADQMDVMTAAPPKSLTAIQLEELQLAKQLSRAQKSGVEETPAWRTMNTALNESFSKIQLEEMRRQQAGMEAGKPRGDSNHLVVHAESKLAPWANQMEVMAAPSKSLTAIQLEELQLAKQLQLARAAQMATTVEEPPAPPTWRPVNTIGESLSKIQLEEMRRHQSGLDDSGRQSQFQQEGLNRLRQLQKPQEPRPDNLNWANWSTRSPKIWEQELRNYQIRQAEEEQVARKPKSLTSNMNPSLVAWASEQLTSMYGPKIYADAVIHLLCKFNTASEMESFIRQSLGTHSKATEFSLNFHKRLVSDEQNENAADSKTPDNRQQSESVAPATDMLEAGRSNSPSMTKKRNKKKGKRVHDSQLGFKPSSAE